MPTAVRLRWTPILLVWLALAVVFLPQALALNAARPEPAPAWMVVLRNGQIFALWALFTPLVVAALGRWPVAPPRRAAHIGLLLLCGAGLALAHLVLMAATTLLLAPPGIDAGAVLRGTATGLAATNVLFAAATFAACAAAREFAARRDAELLLGEARIARLRVSIPRRTAPQGQRTSNTQAGAPIDSQATSRTWLPGCTSVRNRCSKVAA